MYRVVLDFIDKTGRIYNLVFDFDKQQFILRRRRLGEMPFSLTGRFYNALSLNSDNTKESIKRIIDTGMKKFVFDGGELSFYVFRERLLLEELNTEETESERRQKIQTATEIDDYVNTNYNRRS